MRGMGRGWGEGEKGRGGEGEGDGEGEEERGKQGVLFYLLNVFFREICHPNIGFSRFIIPLKDFYKCQYFTKIVMIMSRQHLN